jgi:hypothetical protein
MSRWMSDVTEVLQQRLDADVLSGDVPEEFQVCYLDADVLSGDVPEEFQVCYLDADVLLGDVPEEFQVCYHNETYFTLPEYLNSPPDLSWVRVTRSLVLCVCCVDRCLSFYPFSFIRCVVCPSSIYRF